MTKHVRATVSELGYDRGVCAECQVTWPCHEAVKETCARNYLAHRLPCNCGWHPTTLAELRDQAVANVDARYGYAIEFEPGYDQDAGVDRRAEYDEEQDRLLGKLPLIEAHRQPQPTPQEYDCGCVAVLLITDADYRDGGKPFEMRLLHACGGARCRVHLATGDA